MPALASPTSPQTAAQTALDADAPSQYEWLAIATASVTFSACLISIIGCLVGWFKLMRGNKRVQRLAEDHEQSLKDLEKVTESICPSLFPHVETSLGNVSKHLKKLPTPDTWSWIKSVWRFLLRNWQRVRLFLSPIWQCLQTRNKPQWLVTFTKSAWRWVSSPWRSVQAMDELQWLVSIRDQISYRILLEAHQSIQRLEKDLTESDALMRKLRGDLVNANYNIDRIALQNSEFATTFTTMINDKLDSSINRKAKARILKSLRFEGMADCDLVCQSSGNGPISASGVTWGSIPPKVENSSGSHGSAEQGDEIPISSTQNTAESDKVDEPERVGTEIASLKQTMDQRTDAITVGHCFCESGTRLQRNVVGLYRSLLFQICVKKPEWLADVFDARMGGEDDSTYLAPWTLEDLGACLENFGKFIDKGRLHIFVDGCADFEGSLNELKKVVMRLAKLEFVHVCVSWKAPEPNTNEPDKS